MSTRRRTRRHTSTRHASTRPPHRQPTWLIVGAVIIALGTVLLVAAALLTR